MKAAAHMGLYDCLRVMSILSGVKSRWRVNGIDEMRSRYEAAKAFVANHKGNGAVVASELNAALSMMRPGNLAEPADLKELLEALQAARAIAAPTQRLKDAMGYAEFVGQ